jgi:Flp pilus assembly protein TadB
MSAWLVAGLPFAGGVLVEIASPGTLARTLGHGPGLVLVVVATVLEILGVLAIRRIIDREAIG